MGMMSCMWDLSCPHYTCMYNFAALLFSHRSRVGPSFLGGAGLGLGVGIMHSHSGLWSRLNKGFKIRMGLKKYCGLMPRSCHVGCK